MITARDILSLFNEEYVGWAQGYADIKGINPGGKDIGRIRDIMDKSQGNKAKAMQLVNQMANAITDKDKAQRRAAAVLRVFPKDWQEEAAMAFLSKF